MPLYTVSYKTPLSEDQRDALAAAITKTHSTLFTTPTLFVNVHFEDVTTGHESKRYVAGKRKTSNNIVAQVRPGPSRPRSSYDELCNAINDEWNRIVPEEKLDAVFVMSSIVAGWEQGLSLPEAGKDKEWIKENMKEFERRADAGDEAMMDMVEEIKKRKLN
ncbi:hypothetical protein K490DRAFT_69452 [Saccharata proteae CBS 121410]|uniref:Tautomerase cis-CaaD-like domain-containing protein n=1 Tax=Saccharata proteae CBS 121410 TaxID=1314787 RepID=A0A9P4LU67_9PEZI|nr:hypothetical protein K490DRAFT_69452 [Saccharata proteae CBS 121410]